jgi:hypothetical protein
MGVGGHPFKAHKHLIIESIVKHKGVLVRIAKDFGVERNTIRRKINEDPELIEELANARKDYIENLCDDAEDVLSMALKKADVDTNNGLKSAFYILNNLGRDRGYTPPAQAINPVDENYLKRFELLMKETTKLQKKA